MQPNQARRIISYNLKKQVPPVELSEQNLNTIEKVYSEVVKTAIFKVAFYRFVNFAIAVVWLLVFFLTKGTVFSEYAFIILTSLFLVFNLSFAIAGFAKYLKKRKEFAE